MIPNQSIPLNFEYADRHYKGEAIQASSESTSSCPAFDVFLEDEYTGTVIKTNNTWRSDNHLDSGLLAAIGSVIITLLMTM